MATMNVSLPDAMKAWVEQQTQTGQYSNASDYVRDLIRRDQAQRQAISDLQGIVDTGLASGEAKPFDMTAFITRQKHD